MFKLLFARPRRTAGRAGTVDSRGVVGSQRREHRSVRRAARAAVESLEGRTLLHNPFVTGVTADNRGEVFITLDANSTELSPATFNSKSVQMYEAGADRRAGTADDVQVDAVITYQQDIHRLQVTGDVPADREYRVKIVSSRISIPDPGFAFDGEFSGTFPSGNGAAGGNFEFRVEPTRSKTPTVRMFTSRGQVLLQLRGDLVEKTVNNFLRYVNAGSYDSTYIHRNSRTEGGLAVLQGGGYTNLEGEHIATFPDIGLEAGALTNDRGTIAMARATDPNSANSEFFFNVETNKFLNPNIASDGYAVFGTVRSGMDVLDTIYNRSSPRAIGNFTVPFFKDGVVKFRRVAVVAKVSAL